MTPPYEDSLAIEVEVETHTVISTGDANGPWIDIASGETLLHNATSCGRVGNEKAVEILVKECGANVEATYYKEGAALHVAFERGFGKETGLLLIQLGADEEAKDVSGRIVRNLIADGILSGSKAYVGKGEEGAVG